MAELSTAQHFGQTILPGASLGTLEVDLFINAEPATKSDTVPTTVVYDLRGLNRERNSTDIVRNPMIHFRVIGMIGAAGHDAAQQKMAAIADFMQDMVQQTVGLTHYIGSYIEGDYGFLEYSDERPIFIMDCRLISD